MAVFSTNQNRQFYVVDKVVTTEPKALGEIMLGKTNDEKQFYFKYFGHGGLTRTDLIDVDRVCYAKLTKRDELQRPLKKAVISLDPAINEGKPIAGQDYIVRIIIHNYLAIGDGNTAIKHGAVHAYAGMTAQQFYTKLAESLEMNYSREVVPLLSFTVTATGVEVMEVEQPWHLGTMRQEPVNFQIFGVPVRFQGDDVLWAKRGSDDMVTVENSDTVIGNGKKIADLEYFCMGERGDQYRNMGWPHVIPTAYMVDSSKEYDVLDMHYFFSDTGVNVQKSEKDITFVADTEATLTALKTALTGLGITVEEKA